MALGSSASIWAQSSKRVQSRTSKTLRRNLRRAAQFKAGIGPPVDERLTV
ncbi:hypothetical protein MyChFU_55870 [Mycobacterium intracellulare subsp. chimaera]